MKRQIGIIILITSCAFLYVFLIHLGLWGINNHLASKAQPIFAKEPWRAYGSLNSWVGGHSTLNNPVGFWDVFEGNQHVEYIIDQAIARKNINVCNTLENEIFISGDIGYGAQNRCIGKYWAYLAAIKNDRSLCNNITVQEIQPFSYTKDMCIDDIQDVQNGMFFTKKTDYPIDNLSNWSMYFLTSIGVKLLIIAVLFIYLAFFTAKYFFFGKNPRDIQKVFQGARILYGFILIVSIFPILVQKYIFPTIVNIPQTEFVQQLNYPINLQYVVVVLKMMYLGMS